MIFNIRCCEMLLRPFVEQTCFNVNLGWKKNMIVSPQEVGALTTPSTFTISASLTNETSGKSFKTGTRFMQCHVAVTATLRIDRVFFSSPSYVSQCISKKEQPLYWQITGIVQGESKSYRSMPSQDAPLEK